jgi:adenine-specific DNA methylase
MAGLFQACLAKRPFNLFHRANFYIRTNSVKRSFGNKTTWERPFSELFRKFVNEYNNAVFLNGKDNRVIGGYDALLAPNSVDLVYLDPPYFSGDDSETNYLVFYHFLEGLANYKKWPQMINNNGSGVKIKRMNDTEAIQNFTRKSRL